MRYVLMLAALALALVAVGTAASAPTPKKTLRVNWNETKAFEGGQLDFRVTRLTIQGPKWTVAASIANRSTRTIHIDGITYPARQLAGMSLAYSLPPKGGYYRRFSTNVLQMRIATPRLPTRLGPGQSWTGSFSSFAVLPKAKDIWVIFGWFTPDGRQEESFNHITDHAFRLQR